MENGNSKKYYAFISYSRQDKLIANYFKRALEKFPYPNYEIKADKMPPNPKFVAPIFLDKKNLECTNSSFDMDLLANVKSSKYFIFLCSRASAKSIWCNTEIKAFLDSNNNDSSLIIPILLEGNSLEEIMPEVILGNIDEFKNRNLPDMRTSPDESVSQTWQHALLQCVSYMLGISMALSLEIYRKAKLKLFIKRFSFFILSLFLIIMLMSFFTTKDDSVLGKGENLEQINADTEFGEGNSSTKEGTGAGIGEGSGAGDAKENASVEVAQNTKGDSATKGDVESSQEGDKNSAVSATEAIANPENSQGISSGRVFNSKCSHGAVLRRFKVKLPNDVSMDFIELSKGSFISGGYPIWDECNVEIKKEFSLSLSEVTQLQFKAFYPEKKSICEADDDFPMENISWREAMDFCDKLTKHLQFTGQIGKSEVLSLPTEYQWEYAAKCDNVNDKALRAWDSTNSDFKLHRVKEKEANIWGFFDMNGNLSEWCRDSFDINGASGFATETVSKSKVIKGGSYATSFTFASERSYSGENSANHLIGFRIVIEKKD